MKKHFKALVGLCLISAAGFATAASQSDINAARTQAAKWLITQQKGDGNWATGYGADISATAQIITGLSAAGVKGFPFNSASAWMLNANPQSVDALARQIKSKRLSPANLSTQDALLLSWKSPGTRAVWGSYPQYAASIADTSLALSALLSGSYPATSDQNQELLNSVYCAIFPQQGANGSWPHVARGGTNTPLSAASGAVLPTALTLLALKTVQVKMQWTSGACGGPTYTLSSAFDAAANWLVSQKNTDGGVGENGISRVMSTALAYQGIRAVRPADSVLPGLLDYLIARQNPDGSWGGDPFQTGLVLEQLAATATLPVDTDGDGIPDVVEVALGTNASLADTRALANKGGGNATPGSTRPITLAVGAILNQPFSLTLTSAGVSPFVWSLNGGSLPPGITLSTAGLLTGTPNQLGDFSFQYQALDSGTPSIVRSTLAQISVVRGAVGVGDINGDGVVDLADLILARQFALGLAVPTAQQKAAVDVTPHGAPDGVIDGADLAWITQMILHQR